ncbi:hypothetical protein EYF80_027012 [Liparis tanakae]|uniref:Uncharacterized protein n=1 Tax=Liparis tanakae TaxID=230148 RepID=A0A4Z2HAJ7_9TELE|nr:hypothetical protein EYF80_027012 [Liparis tanakae]
MAFSSKTRHLSRAEWRRRSLIPVSSWAEGGSTDTRRPSATSAAKLSLFVLRGGGWGGREKQKKESYEPKAEPYSRDTSSSPRPGDVGGLKCTHHFLSTTGHNVSNHLAVPSLECIGCRVLERAQGYFQKADAPPSR